MQSVRMGLSLESGLSPLYSSLITWNLFWLGGRAQAGGTWVCQEVGLPSKLAPESSVNVPKKEQGCHLSADECCSRYRQTLPDG